MSRCRATRMASALAAWGLVAAAFLLPTGRPLPFETCLLHRFTGFPCLTCGLTRSVCLFARGEWGRSLSMHPAGWLAFATLVVIAGWLAAETVSGRNLGCGVRSRLLGIALQAGGILSLIGWGARLTGILPPV